MKLVGAGHLNVFPRTNKYMTSCPNWVLMYEIVTELLIEETVLLFPVITEHVNIDRLHRELKEL